VEVQGADSEWYPVVGRQLPEDGLRWRLSNGVVRFTFSEDGATVTPSIYSASLGWRDGGAITARTAVTAGAASDDLMAPGAPVIVRNSPDGVAVRCVDGIRIITFNLRRGLRLMEMSVANAPRSAGSTLRSGLGFVAVTASTALFAANSGLHQTTATADGYFVQLGATPVLTNDTTNGRTIVTTLTAATVTHYIGFPTSDSGTDTGILHDNFLSTTSSTARVVSR
jgi:hypothetical protein